MEERLISIFEECSAALESGENIEDCLSRFPDEAEELRPLLQLAQALDDLPSPEPSVLVSGRARSSFLAEVERRRASTEKTSARTRIADFWMGLKQALVLPSWATPLRGLATVALFLALALIIGGGVIRAADGSLPGDPMYGFKLLGEDIRRAITFRDEDRMRFETMLTAQRRDEVARLLAVGRQEEVDFGGLLEQHEDGRWLVDGISVVLDAEAREQTQPSAFAYVKIQGVTRRDGSVLARSVEIEGNALTGFVEQIGTSRWQVNGQGFVVDAQTRLQGSIQLGDCVQVRLRRFADGALLALEVIKTQQCAPDSAPQEQEGSVDATSTPTATPTPSAEASPTLRPNDTPEVGTPSATIELSPTLQPTAPTMPTATDDADERPAPTATREPTQQPAPTNELEPTKELEPTDELDDTDTPVPPATLTPSLTLTPRPTEEPEPTQVRPTEDPEPTAGPEPTEEPEPTDESDPTDEPEPTDEDDDTDSRLKGTPKPPIDQGDSGDILTATLSFLALLWPPVAQ
jgi:hypothetical protein